MTRARLMGAISHKRNRHVRFSRTLPSPLLRRVFCFSRQRSFEKVPAKAGNGRPGSRGSREESRASEARGLTGGNEAQAGHRWQGEPGKGFASAARESSRAPRQNFVFRFCPPRAGSQFRVVMGIGYFSVQEVPSRGLRAQPFPRKPLLPAPRRLFVPGGDEQRLLLRVKSPPWRGGPCSLVPLVPARAHVVRLAGPGSRALRALGRDDTLSRTLVVKNSDTSHLAKAGSNPDRFVLCRW
jgi:hypothetical protein